MLGAMSPFFHCRLALTLEILPCALTDMAVFDWN